MECTHAYTGIASDTPVGVHLSPHLTKMRGSKSRMKNVSYGCPNLPTLEWWVLRAHTGIDGSLRAHTGIDGSLNPLPWKEHGNECIYWNMNYEDIISKHGNNT